MRAPARNAWRSRSRSSAPPSRSGTGTSSRPAWGTTLRKGWYTGVVTTTLSPGAVKARMAWCSPVITFGSTWTSAGSTLQPHRASARSAKACGTPLAAWKGGYPRSPRSRHAATAALTQGAGGKSISATQAGRTSGP